MLPTKSRRLGTLMLTFRLLPGLISWLSSCGMKRKTHTCQILVSEPHQQEIKWKSNLGGESRFQKDNFVPTNYWNRHALFLASLDASQFCNLQSFLLEQIFLNLTILNFKTIWFSNKTTKLHQILLYWHNTHSNTFKNMPNASISRQLLRQSHQMSLNFEH